MPDELKLMRGYIHRHPKAKLAPGRFQMIAPSAYKTIFNTLTTYSIELEDEGGSKSMTRLGEECLIILLIFVM